MVLASATGFGTLSILAKLGYASGLGTQQMLAFRFLLAAIGMLALAALAGQNPLLMGRSRLLTLLSMAFETRRHGCRTHSSRRRPR